MRAQQTDRTARQGIALAALAFEGIDLAFREQNESDYGIDAHVELIEGDSATGRLLGVQVKAGQSYLSESIGGNYVFRADAKHVDYWINHALPVLVCLADVDKNVVYWQSINNDTAESTGAEYRFMIPKTNLVDQDSLPSLRDLLTMVIPQDRYTLVKTEDASHATAKRYSFKAVLNGTFSKSEIASIIRQLTTEGAERRYYRNHLVERRWGDTDAQVVWTFIYPSMDDYANNNLICRSMWINPILPERERPTALQGENVGDGVIVDWNSYYELLAGMFSQSESTKEEYLKSAIPLIECIDTLIKHFQSELEALKMKHLTNGEFLKRSQDQLQRAAALHTSVNDLPGAPYECNEVDKLLQQIAGNLDDMPLLYSAEHSTKSTDADRLWLASTQMNAAASSMQGLRYELQKVI